MFQTAQGSKSANGELFYAKIDINLPLLRVLSLKDCISFSPLQFIVEQLYQQKGFDYRVQAVLTSLGVSVKTAAKCYAYMPPDERKQVRSGFAQLESRKYFYPVFRPNFIYKNSNQFQISAADFSEICRVCPEYSKLCYLELERYLTNCCGEKNGYNVLQERLCTFYRDVYALATEVGYRQCKRNTLLLIGQRQFKEAQFDYFLQQVADCHIVSDAAVVRHRF